MVNNRMSFKTYEHNYVLCERIPVDDLPPPMTHCNNAWQPRMTYIHSTMTHHVVTDPHV